MDTESGSETCVKQRPDYNKAEQLALDLLEKYHVEEPPVDVVTITEEEGLPVYKEDFSLLPKEKTDRLYISGYINPRAKIICVNKADPYTRRRFTIAHELGHWFMGHTKNEDDYGQLVFRSSYNSPHKEAWEKEANCFAANLLMPKFLMKMLLSDYAFAGEEKLAKVLGVSFAAFSARRNSLGYA